MSEYKQKIIENLISKIKHIKNISIIELGVQRGISTKLFLQICKKNKGKLYSVDIDDCSKVSKDKRWIFIRSKDDNFKKIFNLIPDRNDVIYIDTLHEANHVEKLIYKYYEKLKVNGYMFIDDISHLPYLLNKDRNNFYCEINNQETFERILEIYSDNENCFDINFSFKSSGLCMIKKLNNQKLKSKRKINSRKFSLRNIIRTLVKNFKIEN